MGPFGARYLVPALGQASTGARAQPSVAGRSRPAFGVYLLGRRPPAVPWESCWLKWPDFRLPADKAGVLPVLTEAWQRAVTERVEFGCAGGHGRTGTALACLPSSTASRTGRPSRSYASTTIRTRSRRLVSAATSPGGPPGVDRAAPARSTEAAR